MAVKWFAVKTLYRSKAEGRPEKPDRYYDPDATLLEERLLLIKAHTKTEAVNKAEREARDYAHKTVCLNPYQQNIITQYLGYYDVYEMAGSPNDKCEIYSTTRIFSRRISNGKIAKIYMSPRAGNYLESKRKKFLNTRYTSGEAS